MQVAAVLMILLGVIDLLAGIGVIAIGGLVAGMAGTAHNLPGNNTGNLTTTLGIASAEIILIGVVILVLALLFLVAGILLWKLKRLGWTLSLVFNAASVIVTLAFMVMFIQIWWVFISSLVLPVIILILLWMGRNATKR